MFVSEHYFCSKSEMIKRILFKIMFLFHFSLELHFNNLFALLFYNWLDCLLYPQRGFWILLVVIFGPLWPSLSFLLSVLTLPDGMYCFFFVVFFFPLFFFFFLFKLYLEIEIMVMTTSFSKYSVNFYFSQILHKMWIFQTIDVCKH